MKFRTVTLIVLLMVLTGVLRPGSSGAQTQINHSNGQTVYVPIYSNVFSGSHALPFNLAAMLSIRNIDLQHPVTINSIHYYDNDGKLLKAYLDSPKILAPLASDHIFIKESDEAGGFGANFIVRWQSAQTINSPIIEGVMIGLKSGQGVSFICQGQVIAESKP